MLVLRSGWAGSAPFAAPTPQVRRPVPTPRSAANRSGCSCHGLDHPSPTTRRVTLRPMTAPAYDRIAVHALLLRLYRVLRRAHCGRAQSRIIVTTIWHTAEDRSVP